MPRALVFCSVLAQIAEMSALTVLLKVHVYGEGGEGEYRRCFPRHLRHFAVRHHLVAGPSRPPASTTNPCTAPVYLFLFTASTAFVRVLPGHH